MPAAIRCRCSHERHRLNAYRFALIVPRTRSRLQSTAGGPAELWTAPNGRADPRADEVDGIWPPAVALCRALSPGSTCNWRWASADPSRRATPGTATGRDAGCWAGPGAHQVLLVRGGPGWDGLTARSGSIRMAANGL